MVRKGGTMKRSDRLWFLYDGTDHNQWHVFKEMPGVRTYDDGKDDWDADDSFLIDHDVIEFPDWYGGWSDVLEYDLTLKDVVNVWELEVVE